MDARHRTLIWSCLLGATGICSAQQDAPESAQAAPPVVQAKEPPVVTVEGSWTQYAGGAVSGPVESDIRLGGRFDASIVISGRAVGATDALKLNLLPECVYGQNINGAPGAGLLLPLNSGLQFPSPDGEDCDLSLNIGYRFSGGTTVTVGKINTQANSRATPLVGGGSLDGFQHGFLPTPPTFISQRTLLGVLVTIPTNGPSITVGLWDPVSAVNRSNLKDAFSEGVAGQFVLSFPVKFSGKDGNQKFTLMGSTQEGLDLSTLPDADLPPGSETFLQKSGRWHAQYSFHQYIAQDRENPAHGWGVFGRIGLWDANPHAVPPHGCAGCHRKPADSRQTGRQVRNCLVHAIDEPRPQACTGSHDPSRERERHRGLLHVRLSKALAPDHQRGVCRPGIRECRQVLVRWVQDARPVLLGIVGLRRSKFEEFLATSVAWDIAFRVALWIAIAVTTAYAVVVPADIRFVQHFASSARTLMPVLRQLGRFDPHSRNARFSTEGAGIQASDHPAS